MLTEFTLSELNLFLKRRQETVWCFGGLGRWWGPPWKTASQDGGGEDLHNQPHKIGKYGVPPCQFFYSRDPCCVFWYSSEQRYDTDKEWTHKLHWGMASREGGVWVGLTHSLVKLWRNGLRQTWIYIYPKFIDTCTHLHIYPIYIYRSTHIYIYKSMHMHIYVLTLN